MNEFSVVEIDDMTWEQLVEKSSKPVIVMFYSSTCPFCELMEPYFMNYAQEFENSAVFARMNIVTNTWTAERYGVQGTPTFKSFCHGKPVWEQVGEIDPSVLKTAVENTIKYGRRLYKKKHSSWTEYYRIHVNSSLLRACLKIKFGYTIGIGLYTFELKNQ